MTDQPDTDYTTYKEVQPRFPFWVLVRIHARDFRLFHEWKIRIETCGLIGAGRGEPVSTTALRMDTVDWIN